MSTDFLKRRLFLLLFKDQFSLAPQPVQNALPAGTLAPHCVQNFSPAAGAAAGVGIGAGIC